ncbi:UNVERIFIED_CONTAM: putative lipid-A-disaccharide synthase, mitochondrial [Sesamum latifolium]|uniref:lipid-A-disaccharide synthase n=1 Tax=Sesamum latifolium TaxID=2727402 RepID=A0AAW2T998_9LAMI
MFLRTVWNVKIDMNSSFFRVVKRSLSVSGRESVRDLASKDGELRVFLVAGEVSGDIIASRFMNSLERLSPIPVRFAGVGGLMMSRQGLNSLFPMEDIAVMGIWELLPHLSKFKEYGKFFAARYGEQRLASPQHFHYVAPSFWAWRGGEARLKGLSEFVDHMFCILPFEAEVCRSNGLAATFVGHPTLEDALELKINKCIVNEWKVQGDGEKFRKNYGISSESTIISLLPGSRLQEVTRMLSIYSRTMELLKSALSELTAVIHVAPNTRVEEYISKAVHEWPVSVVLVPGGSPCMRYNSFSMEKSSLVRALGLVSSATLCLKLIPSTTLVCTVTCLLYTAASRLALCTSGTVAVELQLARLPCVVAYRAHLLTEWFIRYKAKIPYISLPNIVLDSPIIPEALFEACTPKRLAPLLIDLMHDESLRCKQVSAAEKFLSLLDPLKRVSGNPAQSGHKLLEYTPSMIAASAVLNS